MVEDDSETRELLRRQLEKERWEVREASNGHIGLELARAKTPELVLLDLIMPEMDGFEFLQEFRSRDEWRSIPVVVITAKDLSEEDVDRLSGNVQKILQKGAYSSDELLTEVRDLVIACSTTNPETVEEPRDA